MRRRVMVAAAALAIAAAAYGLTRKPRRGCFIGQTPLGAHRAGDPVRPDDFYAPSPAVPSKGWRTVRLAGDLGITPRAGDLVDVLPAR